MQRYYQFLLDNIYLVQQAKDWDSFVAKIYAREIENNIWARFANR